MKKLSRWIFIIAILGGGYAIYLGIENESSLIIDMGCIGLGIGLCLMSGKDILYQQ